MTHYVAKLPDKNGYIDFTSEEDSVWNFLIKRQLDIVQTRACDEYLQGLDILNLPKDHVPQCREVSSVLQKATGWSVIAVPALIPLQDFFKLLSERKFPAASFIRTRAEIDYLQEPDIFHELFGHCPLLTHPAYADFVQWYGEQALRTKQSVQSILGRLFWFTIEFGLIQTAKGMRIYGGGILSSYAETTYALESNVPERKAFNLIEILNKSYRYDVIQDCYFYIDQLEDLFSLKSDKIIQMANAITNGDLSNDFKMC